jgi:hypothetical protein
MRRNWKLFLLFALVSLCFIANAQANLKGYTYPYDISQIEWQALNWTAAWRGTTTPADPFTLDRIEYDRNERMVVVYLNGNLDDASDDNLKKSIDGINSLFQQRFTNFDILTDALVYYQLKDKDQKMSYKEYKNGAFADRQSAPEGPKFTRPSMIPPTTSY